MIDAALDRHRLFLCHADHHALLDELGWRGLVYQHTDGRARPRSAAGPVSAYSGSIRRRRSLHVGSLVPVMGLVHLQRRGHRPIALVGGGTGLIGDPSGKTTERQLCTTATGRGERARDRGASSSASSTSRGPNAARMRDNAEWLVPLQRGRVHARRRQALHRELHAAEGLGAVADRRRASRTPSSRTCCCRRTTFSSCRRRDGVTLQVGGSDQWGNITAGIELIRRTDGGGSARADVAAGHDVGRHEVRQDRSGRSVARSATRTSPYKFYQFWINVDDRDVGTIPALLHAAVARGDRGARARHGRAPEKRSGAAGAGARRDAPRARADAARTAEEVSRLLFGKGDPAELVVRLPSTR